MIEAASNHIFADHQYNAHQRRLLESSNVHTGYGSTGLWYEFPHQLASAILY